MPSEAIELTVNINVAEERNKPRLLSILFCDYVNQTVEGKVNLLGTFDRIFADKGASTPKFIIFLRMAETLDGELRLTIISPKEKAVAALVFGGDAERRNPYQQMQLIAPMQFQVAEHGLYWFDLSYKDQTLGGVGLSIEPRPPEPESEQK